ncbi:MAG: heavy metal-binding domain-containing protein [Deltaproteobacteria bacterium]|nr:heavy metal-binding domain-containing protein [Deltaproteobacteria bacterium]
MSQGKPEVLHPDLPVHARERLALMRKHKLFTSDLSVNEFLLVKEAGFEPLGLVMGSSIYQIAPTFPALAPNQPGCEMTDMTRALYHARELAMNRMEEEADELGGDGIVGVRLLVNLTTDPWRQMWGRYRQWQDWARSVGWSVRSTVLGMNWASQWQPLAWAQWAGWCQSMGWAPQPPPWTLPSPEDPAMYALGPNVVEFIAVGTAVRHIGGESFKNKAGKPFQSELTGQDFWTLIRSGYRPVGFVMGNCVFYIPPALMAAPAQQTVELTSYTHGLYDARELAIERLQDEAEALGATGIVGVTVAERQHSFRAMPWNVGNAALTSGEMIELFVIGTAVVPMKVDGEPPKARMVLTVNERAVRGGEGE